LTVGMLQTVNPRSKLICYEMLTCKHLPAFPRTWCVMFSVRQPTLFGLLSPEDGNTTILWNVGNYWPVDISKTWIFNYTAFTTWLVAAVNVFLSFVTVCHCV